MSDHVTLGNVLYPTSDVDAAVTFYAQGLGLPVKFRDGARFAALDGGAITFAIAGPEEDIADGRVSASFKVAHVAEAVERLVDAGAALVRPAEQGPHEVRAVLTDPWGNPFVVYGAE